MLGAATMASLHRHVGDLVTVAYGSPADAPAYVPPTKVRMSFRTAGRSRQARLRVSSMFLRCCRTTVKWQAWLAHTGPRFTGY